jgi:hypothetical protein
LLALQVPRRLFVNGLFALAALLLAIWNAQANTRLSLSKYLTYQYNRTLADQIAAALGNAGWSGSPAPVVLVGKPRVPTGRFLIYSETFGASFFSWGGGDRALIFLYIMGYEVRLPTPEQFEQGARIAATMPAWPLSGSVVFRDGMGVVNFGGEP